MADDGIDGFWYVFWARGRLPPARVSRLLLWKRLPRRVVRPLAKCLFKSAPSDQRHVVDCGWWRIPRNAVFSLFCAGCLSERCTSWSWHTGQVPFDCQSVNVVEQCFRVYLLLGRGFWFQNWPARCSWIEIICDFAFATRFGCVPTVISPQKSARWHAQRLARCVTSVRTVVTVKSIQCTVCLCLPMPMLCLPSCSRCAGILKEKQHLVYARLLFEWFPSFDLHTTGDWVHIFA